MNNMNTIGVIGWGYVGHSLGEGFATNRKNRVRWFDKYKESPCTLDEVIRKSDFVFVCLPTPMFRDYSGVDMSIVNEVVNAIAPKLSGTGKILIIKSTVLPGTTARFAKKYPTVKFAMSPEFVTQKNSTKDFLKPARTVIGTEDARTAKAIRRLYQTILPKNTKFFLTDTTSAELSKYMSNLILASKVLLANEFYFLAKKIKAQYGQVREIVEADPRIGTFLKVPGWDGDFGFGQACFPKDMLGLLAFAKQKKVDMAAFEAVWEKNLKIRKTRDWEKKDNAFGRGAASHAASRH